MLHETGDEVNVAAQSIKLCNQHWRIDFRCRLKSLVEFHAAIVAPGFLFRKRSVKFIAFGLGKPINCRKLRIAGGFLLCC
jgi:hypothetical protein